MRRLKKENEIEEYEKNLAIFGLLIFIVLGVVFMTFILPMIYGINESSNVKSNDNAISYQNSKEDNGYKSGLNSVKKNNYSEALNYFQKAVENDPDNIEYLTELAVTNYRLKNYDESTRVYNKIISLEENNVMAYNSIGNNYWIKKDYEKAEISFRKAIEINPFSIPSYNNLALMLDEMGKRNEAIEIINQGLETNANNSELKITLRILEK